RVEDVATPEGFRKNPALVHRFYNLRRAQLKQTEPNAAHRAIAEFAAHHKGTLTLITQNVDDLHDRAETGHIMPAGYSLLHMHGQLRQARCRASDEVFAWEDDMDESTPCPCCGKTARLRPHIVWFGEMPLYMNLIDRHLARADLFLSIGTSGNVYPAAGFVQQVRHHGHGHTVELNMEPSLGHSLFAEKIYGPAGTTVPEFLNSL
ncbi:MAG: NAD-dependent protein deacylase, partial [Rickettsiales bacterium]|nr:NAD-dependent protein deacylase [Rickettsiales bacterium]